MSFLVFEINVKIKTVKSVSFYLFLTFIWQINKKHFLLKYFCECLFKLWMSSLFIFRNGHLKTYFYSSPPLYNILKWMQWKVEINL